MKNLSLPLILSLMAVFAVRSQSLPSAYQTNWFDPSNGSWLLGLQPQAAAYAGDLWEYHAIEKLTDAYQIELLKSDTSCYYNAEGAYVCEWKTQQRRLLLREKRPGQLLIKEDGRELLAFSDPQACGYQPSATLTASTSSGLAILKGFVINASRERLDQGVSIYVNDPLYADQVSYSTAVDENGYFYLKVPLAIAQDVFVRPGKSLFLEPGKTLILCLDAQQDHQIYFMGANAELNRDLTQFNRNPANNFDFRADRGNMHLEPESYRQSRLQLQQQYLKAFAAYIRKNTVSPAFEDWFARNAELRLYDDLMRYAWQRPNYKGGSRLEDHPTYFARNSAIDISDQRHWFSSYFQSYVDELFRYYRNLSSLGHDQVFVDSLLLTRQGTEGARFLKNYTLFTAFNQVLQQVDAVGMDQYLDTIMSLELEPGQRDHLQWRYDEIKEKMSGPLPSYASMIETKVGSAEALLQQIARKHAGKRVYLDVWAPWCQPCRQEMERSRPMKAAFRERDIATVYLCESGDKKTVEYLIKKYELEGDHYYLSPQVRRELQDLIRFTGIPHYFIMNTRGQIVNRNAPRPRHLDQLLAEMDKASE